MTLTDLKAADLAADAQQAAYFREALDAQRQLLLDSIGKRRALIDRGSLSGHQLSSVRSAEAEVRYLTRMIDRLAHRFPTAEI